VKRGGGLENKPNSRRWTTKRRRGDQQHTQRSGGSLSESPKATPTKCAKNKITNRKQRQAKGKKDGGRGGGEGGKEKKNQGGRGETLGGTLC
jgi:hypothetical protein